ncbi:hypothetical protein Nepgr_010246 [Nepenthes gracilis]|uniref:Glutaredoxin-dependent peroxiredoxin n=1 Tax=Nepenthes gracilis TaxID=150966 RepID=A0AAD3SCT5_NEPGR|nr:hypothetical protein Nepgr_010246 [Nepenthes gracilis]
MAAAMLKRSSMMKSVVIGGLRMAAASRAYASVAVGSDIISAAPNVSLQKARTWDEGLSSKFSSTPLTDIFKAKKVVIFGLPGAFTGVCSSQHVPSYKNNIDKFKARGIDLVICVSVNDPYVMNGWAEKLLAKDAIEFYGDFDGSFHKSLDLTTNLSSALLGTRSHRWSAYVEDGKIKILNVEKVPSEFKAHLISIGGAKSFLGRKKRLINGLTDKQKELQRKFFEAIEKQELVECGTLGLKSNQCSAIAISIAIS